MEEIEKIATERKIKEIMLDQIKQIIFGVSKKGGMCESIEDGQIIGLRTGKDLEFDLVAEGLYQYFSDLLKVN